MFEEAAHVPLIIYHPDSPFKGERYKSPVESVDVYPTLLDLAGVAPYGPATCPSGKCLELEGESLAPIVLGEGWTKDKPGSN